MVDTTGLAAASLTFSVLSFVMLIITLIVFLFPDFSASIRAGISRASGSGGGFFSNVKMVFALLGAFSPDITLLSGFVSDIVNGNFRYSVTSIIGIISVIVHWGAWRILRIFNFFSDGASPAASPPATDRAAAAATVKSVVPSRAQNLGTGSVSVSSLTRNIDKALKATKGNSASQSGDAVSFLNPLGEDQPVSNRTRSNALGRGRGGGAEDIQTGGAWSMPPELASSFNPCAIRGLGMFDTTNSAMGMSALSAVWTVYMLDMVAGSKRTPGEIGGYVGFSAVVFGMNVYSYKTFQCYGSLVMPMVLPIIVGLACGGIGYGVLRSSFPAYLPLDAQAINSPSAPSQPSCAPPNDKDQFVCDAYKNGKRVTTSVVS